MSEVWRIEKGEGGLDRLVVDGPAGTGEVYLQGAHLTSWIPRGQRPVIFMSSRCVFAPGKAIRGGVPIIFPWFGARSDGKPGPQHGFARTAIWELKSASLVNGSDVAAEFRMAAEEYAVRFDVTFGAQLDMALEVTNTGASEGTFEEAFHTYFAVSDVRDVAVEGLAATSYIDKTDGFRRKTQVEPRIRIAKENDAVFLNTAEACVVKDPGWGREIVVEKSGSLSTVVWNPWVEKTAGMSDMGPDDWKGMICIETAKAADNAVKLAAGDTHRMTARISVRTI
ncbi:MAG: D-hexose-6-phosphate mutarotase [Acidobacteriota bacterium]|nr:D-hexose-6-phosphate mutarotase [Acidobacteriota bacterium]